MRTETGLRLTAQQQAYLHLQDRIVSGALPGGARLKPELIAAELGISRMPVREAIRQLDAEGYVIIRPNRGAVVTTRTRFEILELFEIRASLEGLALRFGAELITTEELQDLELQLQRLRVVTTDHLSWIDRHDELHNSLCKTSHRPNLEAECRRFRLAVQPYMRLYLKNAPSPELAGFEHEHLLDALRRGDAEQAEFRMRKHIVANAEAIAACLPHSLVATSAA